MGSYKQKKIAHFSFSSFGGAGIVAKNLQNYQKKSGLDSTLFVNTSTNLYQSPIKDIRLTLAATIDNYLVKRMSSSNLFSLFRPKIISSFQKIDITDIDIFHLHWITDLHFIEKVFEHSIKNKKKVVWTIHDMWVFTGGCHHSDSCNRFLQDCGSCPQAYKLFHDSVKKSKKSKLNLLSSNPNINFVFPSRWIQENVNDVLPESASSSVIPNPIHLQNLYFRHKSISRKNLNIQNGDLIVGFIATELSDSNKNIFKTIDTINKWGEINQKNILVVLAGNLTHGSRKSYDNVVYLGKVTNSKLNDFYNSLDFLFNFSHKENLPLSIIEAMSCGVPVVAKKQGGITELIEDSWNGYLFDDLDDLFVNFYKLLNANHKSLSLNCLDKVKLDLNEAEINERYINIYDL